ncbi:histidine kinase famiy protein [Rhizosaccharibacter radicis]|uniref:histidine kinase n=1 Tax=Rhizosaccharibacter radicis TaxID=2782605 RepID=A0ABT1VTF4_9PROT|nr:histidine kinase famiy protein [Acetobacteraceae bacterium KSS12]
MNNDEPAPPPVSPGPDAPDGRSSSDRQEEPGGASSGLAANGIHDEPDDRRARDPDAGDATIRDSPTGGPGIHHWKQATITEPGLDQRGSVFFAAIQMTRMPMVLTDPNQPDNPIVFANRAFQDLTGYEQHEITGRNCRFLQGPGTDRASVRELRDAIAERRAMSVELLNYRRDGSTFWNAVFVAPVYGTDGQLLYFFASQLDVTRRRSSEQAFRQAQKMESIGQLTAGLAHDFNNLLQVVSGSLEILRARVADERLLRHVANATAAAERGARLTRQLLAFARKTRLEPRALDINGLINEFAEVLESTAGRGVELQLSLRRRLPPVAVDPVHLEMALLNVLINARDATPEGGTITIATGSVELPANGLPAGRYVTLSVSDQGTGMTPEVLERAVEPFFTTKPTGKGTGLGLAMAHGFAQQSLGRLEIESEQRRGTTVRMLFPAAEQAVVSAPPASPTPATTPADALPGGNETILVVEDSEDVLALAREHLHGLGYTVLTAFNADEALRVLEAPGSPRVDLLFSDLVMPGGMNGLALADRVRGQRPGIGVLLTTGYNEDLVADGPRATAMDVLGKPYRRIELADRVRAALDRRDTDPANRTPPRSTGGPAHEA